jgi:AraC family transcriptional regulator of adaptative response/methylated-DNA-[protein]-cysteine methyltransferase
MLIDHMPASDRTRTPTPSLPTPERMYRALVDRDVAFDGHFVVGVKSTGIFCRCVCTARKPLRKNVEFFATPKDAMHAGYRACLRCRPLEDPAGPHAPGWLEKLKQHADEHPDQRLRDADLLAMKLDPSTVRRQFKARFGMTFQAYARARRMGLALAAVRQGKTIDQAKARGGYASDSGFRDAFARLFGTLAEAGTRTPVLAARWIDTPLGPMLALVDDEGLRLLDFVDRRGLERQIARIRARLGCVIVPGEHDHLDRVQSRLDAYFAGHSRLLVDPDTQAPGSREPALGVPLVPGGGETPFQKRVWAQLRSIPLGQTRSYAQQARAIGNPAAVRAVARANGENFIALITPCHRVIGSDGSMTGYGGGVCRKQWLLEHERKMIERASHPRS